MKVAVLGTGLMGSAAAFDLLNSESVEVVKAVDSNRARITALRKRFNSGKLVTELCDVSRDRSRLTEALRGFDVCLGALPNRFALNAVQSAAKAGVNYVDLIIMWRYDRDLWRRIDKLFRRRGLVIVSPCGLAPGLTNILALRASSQLDKVDTIKIYTGGLPLHPTGPLGYVVLWSLEDVWEMYTRPSIIVEGGRARETEPMSGLEYLNVRGIGRLEAFYSDGLSTLVKTLKGVNVMWEKTLRYPGHAQKVKTLMDCGMLQTQPIGHGIEMTPRQVLNTVLGPKLVSKKGEKDVTVGLVEAIGTTDGAVASEKYELIDHSDDRNGINSIARTTAYVASIAAQMIASERISERGFVPPELAFGQDCFESFMDELRERRIKITHRRSVRP
jgi:lysine 6-dehydrogenase